MTIHARAVRLTAVAALAGCTAACATVTRGSSTAWQVQTSPSGASVVTSNGKSCDPTPCSIRVARKSRFTATITKVGYKPASVSVSNEISYAGAAGLVGNVVVGGLIGVGVDAVSGAALDLTPNPSIVKLERDASAATLVAYVPTLSAPAPPSAPVRRATAPAAPSHEQSTITAVSVATAAGTVTYETYTPNEETRPD